MLDRHHQLVFVLFHALGLVVPARQGPGEHLRYHRYRYDQRDLREEHEVVRDIPGIVVIREYFRVYLSVGLQLALSLWSRRREQERDECEVLLRQNFDIGAVDEGGRDEHEAHLIREA